MTSTAPWSDASHAAIGRWLAANAGLFCGHRVDETEAAVARAVRRLGLRDAADLAARLAARDVDAGPLFDEVTVRETAFFRHAGQLSWLRDTVVPSLPRRARVWSAGCASGEEAYTLAILAREAGVDAVVAGTDVSAAAVDAARAATYRSWALRFLTDVERRRWFTERGGRYALAPEIAADVTFSRANLLDGPPATLGRADLVLCRNVLIYFDADAVARAARALWDALADGGTLVTGPSDPLLVGLAPFEAIETPAGLAWRRPRAEDIRPAAVPVPATRPHARPAAVDRVASRRDARPAAVDGAASRPAARPAAPADHAAAAVDNAPLDPAPRLHLGLVLASRGRLRDAAAALDHALYLDDTLAFAWFLRAELALAAGDAATAARGWRNARALAAARRPDDEIPLADGATAGELTAAADARLGAAP